jgi:hypothetical protein
MTPAEILGVEIKQYIGENLKTLVPRVLGKTGAAEITKGKISSRENSNWTEESFKEAILNKHGQKALDVVNKILKWATSHVSYVWYGKGEKHGSLVPTLLSKDRERYCFAIWTYGSIEIYFQYIKDKPPFNDEVKRRELLDKLNAIEGINIPLDKISKRPNIPLQMLYSEENLKAFLSVFDWYFQQIRPFV